MLSASAENTTAVGSIAARAGTVQGSTQAPAALPPSHLQSKLSLSAGAENGNALHNSGSSCCKVSSRELLQLCSPAAEQPTSCKAAQKGARCRRRRRTMWRSCTLLLQLVLLLQLCPAVFTFSRVADILQSGAGGGGGGQICRSCNHQTTTLLLQLVFMDIFISKMGIL